MRKDAILSLALLVSGDACGDDDRDWTATWTMPDGSEVVEPIIDPITDRPILNGATAVQVDCPACHRYWKVSDEGGLILGETGVAS